MITLKIEKAICPVCDVKNSNRAFIGKWQTDNFGALFTYICINNYGSTQTYTKLKIYNHHAPKYSTGFWEWKEN